jgi:hypothetical protein
MSAGFVAGLRPSGQFLANGIVGATSLLVRNVMQRNWTAANAVARRRRILLRELEQVGLAIDPSCVEALRQAVLESDSALAAMCSIQVPALPEPMVR